MFINELKIFHLIKSSNSSDSSTGLVTGFILSAAVNKSK